MSRWYKVCIDPGHGGKDPGAVVGEHKEADINLLAAHLLKGRLEKIEGVLIDMTRYNPETTTALRQRVLIANESGADVFISLHCNKTVNPDVRGFEVLYCNGSTNGEKFARTIERVLKVLPIPSRGVKPRPRFVRKDGELVKVESRLAVLSKTAMPAVLLEMGFMSNPLDLGLLLNTDFLTKLTDVTAAGIYEYLTKEVKTHALGRSYHSLGPCR